LSRYIQDLVETDQSILMLGHPGVRKTTALREITRILADDLNKRVVIIDSSDDDWSGGRPHTGNHHDWWNWHRTGSLTAGTISEQGGQPVGTVPGNQFRNCLLLI